MGFGWEGDLDGVVGVDGAAALDGGHDAGSAGALAGGVARAPEVLLEAGAEGVDLRAGGAEAGDFEDGGGGGVGADEEVGAEWEAEEVEAAGEEVFAQFAGGEGEAFGGQLVEHLGGEEVDLAEVGSGGVLALEVEVLDGAAAVGVAFDAFVGDEGDAGLRLLGEAVGGAAGGGDEVGMLITAG